MNIRQPFIYLGFGVYKPYAVALARKLNVDPKNYLNEPDDLKKISEPTNSLLVIPGGRLLSLSTGLSKKMDYIRSLISNGCTYLGVCAGASLACGDAHFMLENKPYSLSSLKLNRLELLPKVLAYHTTLGPTQLTPQIVPIRMQNKVFSAFFHEGCHFKSAEKITVLASYESVIQKPPAVIQGKFNDSTVSLFGIHPEHPDSFRRVPL